MSDPVTVVTVATAVVCALVGGAFFAFSNWVMDALARRPGALLYTVGCAGLTMVANVPLNNELARQDPDDPRAVEVWQRFLSRWTTWNTARTLGSSRRSGAPDHRGDRRPMTHPQRPQATAQLRTRRTRSKRSGPARRGVARSPAAERRPSFL